MTENQFKDLQKDWAATGETEPFGAGHSKWWFTGYRDPFVMPALLHDMEYTFKRFPRCRVDDDFYQRCLNISFAANKKYKQILLILRAQLYYYIVLKWHSEGWPEGC